MPGPVSDSSDPEFGTGSNAAAVHDAIVQVREYLVTARLGAALQNIVEVVDGPQGKSYAVVLTVRELRIIRFALNRALESL
jgi:hypothetical protein